MDSETEDLINATGCGSCTKPDDVTELGVSKYSDTDDNVENGTIADNLTGTYTFSSPDWNHKIPFDEGYYVEFKVRDFSEFWLNNGWFNRLTALPVDLLSFTARKHNGKDVLAEWVTATEQDLNRFEIEVARTNDDYLNRRFYKLGEVAGSGNSSTQKRYSFLDTEVGKTGARYYRLKIIDNDGTFVYSPIRPVIFSNETQWQVYPNPSKGVFNLVYQIDIGETIMIKLYDANGRVLKNSKVEGTGYIQKTLVNLDSYSSGIYLLSVKAGDKEQSFRLVKQ